MVSLGSCFIPSALADGYCLVTDKRTLFLGNHFFVTKRYFFSSSKTEELLARQKHRIRSPNETQSESILAHGEVALIAIHDWLKANGVRQHEVEVDALGDPRIGRLTRTGPFTIEVFTNKYPAHWYDNGRTFDDSFGVVIEAINFQERWSRIREARSENLVSRLRDNNSPPAPCQTQGLSDARAFHVCPAKTKGYVQNHCVPHYPSQCHRDSQLQRRSGRC